ncbi:hypothetical protein [Microbacterium sp. NPDC087665]|uniref:hypothetical protein n=1 Tax=Microbacterium sp. NPDC087665 TaxID=3364194 RepID=UPI0037FBA43E
MTDMMTEIAVQSISALVGAGVASIPPLIQLARTKKTLPQAKGAGSADRGSSAVVAGESINGDVTVSIDNSRVVISNMTNSAPKVMTEKAPSASDGAEWGAFVAVAVAAALFASYYTVLSWFVLGVIAGVVVTSTVGAVRARRWRLWDRASAIVATEVILALAATVWAWIAIFTAEHAGASLESLRARIAADVAASPAQPGVGGWLAEVFIAPVATFFKIAIAENQFIFVLSLFAAFLFSFALMLIGWSRLYNWYTYMGFFLGKGSERAVKRALRHSELKASDLMVFMILAGLTAAFASGLLVVLADHSFTHPPLPAG